MKKVSLEALLKHPFLAGEMVMDPREMGQLLDETEGNCSEKDKRFSRIPANMSEMTGNGNRTQNK